MKTVVTITMNPAVDRSAFADEIVPDRKVRCVDVRREAGGGGINVSRAIGKLGGKSTAVFPVGGPTGEILRQLVEEERIATRCVSSEAWARENITVIDRSTEQQYRFTMPGPALQESEWRAILQEVGGIPEADYVVASGSLPPGVPEDFYALVGAEAEKLGARLIIDTSGGPLRHAIRQGAYLLKPNAREFGQLMDEPFETEEQQETLARRLIDEQCCTVLVLSLGAAGVLMATPDGIDRVRSPSVPITSKVGAGDSTVAGIVYGLAHDLPIRQAVCLGVAAGAAAVMTPGSELCRREDVAHLLGRLCDIPLP